MRKFFLAFIFIMHAGIAKCQIAETNRVLFKYPFSQEDAKWKSFETVQERITALQIPDSTLKQIPTEDLLLICLDFPYLSDVFAFDDMANGINAVALKFNGLKEFLKRQDQIEVLEKNLLKISQERLFLMYDSNLEIGRNSMRISVLSYLLARPEIQNKLTLSQKEDLLKLTQNAIDTISRYTSYNYSLGSSALYLLKQTLNGTVNRAISGDYYSVIRYTPNGSPVLAWKLFQNELNENDNSRLVYDAVRNYDAIIISEATKAYNCHGYAWHMAEDGDTVWIGLNSLTDENIYWEDGSYIEVPEAVATKVSYYESYDANHSAIRLSNNLYRSKWGPGPLVEHEPNACPYNTTLPKKYYMRAPILSGPNIIINSEQYTISNLPNSMCVVWGIDNNNFSLSLNGNQCDILYEGTAVVDSAAITATISYNGIVIKTLSKEIYHIEDIDGETAICSQENYSLNGLPNDFSVSWNIDNSNYSISPSSNQCLVSYNEIPQYDVAILTATITKQGQTIGTLTKRIVMHGTDLFVEGWQIGSYSPNGTYPDMEFTIPNNIIMPSRARSERPVEENLDDKESLPINFTREIIPDDPIYSRPVDQCGYGITEIYGGNTVNLNSDRFDGMDISFSGSLSPTFYYRSENNGRVTFKMPYQNTAYYTTLHAQSDGHCHDFCLSFKVLPLPGSASGDEEIWVELSGSTLNITFLGSMGTPIGNGQIYVPNYTATIWKMPLGTLMYSHTAPSHNNYFSVDTSSWTSGIYTIRIVQDGNVYSKSIVL